jgi:hypothetical protein
MSGYLQRLALNALNPGGSIHPVLGSVFAGPRSDRSHDDIAWEEVVVSRDEPGPLMTPSPTRPGDFQSSDEVPGPPVSPVPPLQTSPLQYKENGRSADAKPIHDGESLLKPLLTQAQQNGVASPVDRTVIEDGLAAQSQPLLEPRGRERNEERTREGAYSPIMPEFVPGATPPSIFGDSPNVHPREAVAGEKSVMPRRDLGYAAVTPDEIQIHIGRIEVTAVPQAPAAPTAKPAAKSVSLDEYLKRRDARAL